MTFRPLQDTQLSLSNLQDEMYRLFGRIWHAGLSTGPFDGQKWAPFVDLYEYDDRYTLYAEVPGVEGNEVDLTHIGHALTIRGEKVRPAGLDEDKRPIHGERRFGVFSRTIDLPADRLGVAGGVYGTMRTTGFLTGIAMASAVMGEWAVRRPEAGGSLEVFKNPAFQTAVRHAYLAGLIIVIVGLLLCILKYRYIKRARPSHSSSPTG